MLCEICQKRPALVHTTTIVADKTSVSHLCRECFEPQSLIADAQFVKGISQTCDYCGAEINFGVLPGAPRISVVVPGVASGCRECSADFEEFIARHLPALAPSTEEEFTRELEAYMKKRIAQRRSGS